MRFLSILNKKKFDQTGLSPRGMAWKRFRKNKFALGSIIFLLVIFTLALLGYLITPDSTPLANSQHLELTTQKPGSRVKTLKVRRNIDVEQKSFLKKMFYGERSKYDLIPVNSIKISDEQVIIEEFTSTREEEKFIRKIHLVDVVFPVESVNAISKRDNKYFFTGIHGDKKQTTQAFLEETIHKKQLTSKTFWLGTDRFGRDLLSRLIIGARISLSVGFISVFISLLIGITLGSIAGYFRGIADDIIMWLINVVWSIPTLLMVIAITLVIGKGFWQIFIAVGLTMWVEVARVIRGQIISIREKEFVEAARAMGFRNSRIITKHILPNVINPVIIISAANFASAILIEAGLSFLGIGVQPPMPSWGTMIKEHYGYILIDMGYLAILPGLAIMLTVLSFTLIGNGLRDALDTKG
jgi:peptide/nickel transport system permease protein